MPVAVEELHGEWVGNGCMCTPSCNRARVGKSMCGTKNFCIYPGMCGCGPSCPEPCGTDMQPCPMMGEDVYCNCFNFIKVKDSSTMTDICGFGCGYVKKAGGAPDGVTNEAMER